MIIILSFIPFVSEDSILKRFFFFTDLITFFLSLFSEKSKNGFHVIHTQSYYYDILSLLLILLLPFLRLQFSPFCSSSSSSSLLSFPFALPLLLCIFFASLLLLIYFFFLLQLNLLIFSHSFTLLLQFSLSHPLLFIFLLLLFPYRKIGMNLQRAGTSFHTRNKTLRT